MREKCFLHVRQTSFLHAGKMFFTSSTGTRRSRCAARRQGHALRANSTAWRPISHGLRPTHGLTAERQRPAAGRIMHRNQEPVPSLVAGRSAAIMHRNQVSRQRLDRPGSGARGLSLAHVSPAPACSCSGLWLGLWLLPGSCPGSGSTGDQQGRPGVPDRPARAGGARADMGRPPVVG